MYIQHISFAHEQFGCAWLGLMGQYLHKSMLLFFCSKVSDLSCTALVLFVCRGRAHHVGPLLFHSSRSILLIHGSPWKLLVCNFPLSAQSLGSSHPFPLWSTANGAGSGTHERLYGDQPALSGDVPAWIHLPAKQLSREVWALFKVYVRLRLQSAKSEAVVERRDSLEQGGGCGPPAVSSKRGPQQLWLSGEVQRAVRAARGVGLKVTWQLNLTSKTKMLCLDFHIS